MATKADSSTPSSKKGRVWLWSVLGVVGAAIAAYIGAVLFTGSQAGTGTTVAGLDIGGMNEEQALALFQEELVPREESTLELTARDTQVEVTPAELGLSFDAPATARQAAGMSWDPRVLWDRLSGEREVEPIVHAEEDYPAQLSERTEGLSADPVDAGIVFSEDGQPEVTPAETGYHVDHEAAAEALRTGWLTADGSFELPVVDEAPAADDDAAARALEGIAEPAVSAEVVIDAEGQELTVSPEVIAATLGFEAREGELVPVFDAEALRERALEDNPEVGEPARDAGFRIEDGSPVVVPSEDGDSVEAEDLAQEVSRAMLADERTGSVELKVLEPEFTTQDAENLDLSDTVSEFSTPYSSEPNRDNNLRVASESVSGTVLMPGEQFSLNETLGQRTAANGYRPAGVISGGQMREDYGGGVSQVSTTLFNAAFFAGFQLDEHQAHSRWISRYPEGRETTLDWHSIDLKFTNTSDHPVVMHMWLGGGQVHAKMFGVKTVDVEAGKSERFAYTSASTVHENDPQCRPQAPQSGWSVTIYRTIKEAGSDEVVSEDQFTTVYRPVNRVICED